MDTILEIRDVDYYYQTKANRINILNSASFSFENNKLYAICGPSGSGKSTTLSLLGALEAPKKGSIFFKDQDIQKIGYTNYRNMHVGIVFQAYNLLNYLSPLENVLTSMEITKVKIENKKDRAIEILKEMGLDETLFNRNINVLSGGEQQRVAIARAIAKNADIILADEPTGNLDPDTAKGIIDIFEALAHDKHKCVIVVTHSEDLAKQADKIVKLENKRLVSDNGNDVKIYKNFAPSSDTVNASDTSEEPNEPDTSYSQYMRPKE